jgi:hypothetical protein
MSPITPPPSRLEVGLLTAMLSAIALAAWGPSVPQFAHYHAFADQRHLLGIPCALDVLSNALFAVLGAVGLWRLNGLRSAHRPPTGQRTSAVLFFAGLILTALCSGWYHLHPDDAGLTVDRLGMVSAFAGLLGLAAADRISVRAGHSTAIAVLLLGPLCVAIWAFGGNLLPWSVLQGGGMLVIVWLATRRPRDDAWGLPLGAVIAWYALAKTLELGDHTVFALSQGLVSGHTLKHLAAAMAAWPVFSLMHNGTQARPWHLRAVRA